MNIIEVDFTLQFKLPDSKFRLFARMSEDNTLVFDVITEWVCPSHPEVPIESELVSWMAEWKATEAYLFWKFDAQLAIAREAQVFTAEELVRLMPFSYTLNELIRYKNFWGGDGYVGLQQVSALLVSQGKLLQSDYDKLASLLLEQNIILDKS